MKTLFCLAAQALIEHSAGRSEKEIADACNAAMDFLLKQGISLAQLRKFAPAVRRELRRQKRVVPVRVVTLGEADTKYIVSTVTKTLNADVDLTEAQDRTLIGGAILEVGDERLDVSVRGALKQLAIHLTSA